MIAVRRIGRRVSLLVLALALPPMVGSGCSRLRTDLGHPIPFENLPPADSAVHYRDVLDVLGPPTRMSTSDSHLLFLYEYASIEERQVGVTLNISWLNLFKFTMGKGTASRQSGIMVFDHSGYLLGKRFEEWDDALGGGNSVQLAVALLSVIDTADLRRDPYQHLWGAGLLEADITAGLNRQSSLITGASGVELLGTPRGAGQHALESRPLTAGDAPQP